jgi:hypothetical protein
MPWSKLSRHKLPAAYKALFDKIIMKKRDPEMTVREVFIRTQILKYDFTKRQLCILSTIITFSYFYGKKTAWIPKLKDFSLSGVSPTKITGELEALVDMNVITWHRGKDFNEFEINSPTEWRAPYHSGFDSRRSEELFFLNLKHADIPFDIDEFNEADDLL